MQATYSWGMLGCNDRMATSYGASTVTELIGKSAEPYITKKQNDIVSENDRKVIETGQATTCEEPGTLADGKETIFLSRKKLYIKLFEFYGKIVFRFVPFFSINRKAPVSIL